MPRVNKEERKRFYSARLLAEGKLQSSIIGRDTVSAVIELAIDEDIRKIELIEELQAHVEELNNRIVSLKARIAELYPLPTSVLDIYLVQCWAGKYLPALTVKMEQTIVSKGGPRANQTMGQAVARLLQATNLRAERKDLTTCFKESIVLTKKGHERLVALGIEQL